MMTIRGFLPAIVIALLAAIVIALLAAAVMDFNSGSTIANAINVGTSTTTDTDVPATTSTTTTTTTTTSRNLFELPLPFDSVNNECKRTCDNISQEGEENENDNDNDFLINACPKVSSQEELKNRKRERTNNFE